VGRWATGDAVGPAGSARLRPPAALPSPPEKRLAYASFVALA
jgi:hypothetical protein